MKIAGGGNAELRKSQPRCGRQRVALVALLLGLSLFLPGCASTERQQRAKREEPIDRISYWAGYGMKGPPRIVIDLSEQRAYFYKGKELAGISIVSTGMEGYATPTGQFKVKQKDLDHASDLYGDYVDNRDVVVQANVSTRLDPLPPGAHFVGAPMPYFMRIVGAIGMHQGYLPGVPASHGCIRLPAQMAQAFYDASELGTPVEIRP